MAHLAAASSRGRRDAMKNPLTARGGNGNEDATEEDIPHLSVKTILLKKTDDIAQGPRQWTTRSPLRY
jgi:hypothetical protein